MGAQWPPTRRKDAEGFRAPVHVVVTVQSIAEWFGRWVGGRIGGEGVGISAGVGIDTDASNATDADSDSDSDLDELGSDPDPDSEARAEMDALLNADIVSEGSGEVETLTDGGHSRGHVDVAATKPGRSVHAEVVLE